MGQIDIMSHKAAAQMASFTVDITQPYVALSVPVSPAGIMYNFTNLSFFRYLDHFQILSIGVRMPLGFEFYEVLTDIGELTLPTIDLTLRPNAGPIQPLEPNGIKLPFEDYELNYGTYFNIIDTGLTVGTIYQLIFNFRRDFTHRVSMINVPSGLDGETFYIPIFAKILHTLTLIA